MCTLSHGLQWIGIPLLWHHAGLQHASGHVPAPSLSAAAAQLPAPAEALHAQSAGHLESQPTFQLSPLLWQPAHRKKLNDHI